MLIEAPTCSTLVLVTEGPSLEFQKWSLPLGGRIKGHLKLRGRLGEMHLLKKKRSHCVVLICGRKCGWHYLGSIWWAAVTCLET